jgi:hypothetical protein
MIGEDAALDILQQYNTDNRYEVVDELLSVWSRFDIKDYAVKVLQPCVTAVNPDGIRTLNGYQYLTNLQSLVGYLPCCHR